MFMCILNTRRHGCTASVLLYSLEGETFPSCKLTLAHSPFVIATLGVYFEDVNKYLSSFPLSQILPGVIVLKEPW